MNTRTFEFANLAAFLAALPQGVAVEGDRLVPLPAGVHMLSIVGPLPPEVEEGPPGPFAVVLQGATPAGWAAAEVFPAAPPRVFLGGGSDAPAPTLAELKATKNAAINAARLAANRSTFTHAGKVFACDELSRGDIDGINGFAALFGALPPGWPGAWKAVDNTYLPVPDLPAWKAFYAAMIGAGNAHFAQAQTLKAALALATTPEAVAQINWSTPA